MRRNAQGWLGLGVATVAIVAALVAALGTRTSVVPPSTELAASAPSQEQWEADPRVLDDTLNHAEVMPRLWYEAVARAEAEKAATAARKAQEARSSRGRTAGRGGSFQRDPAIEACIIRHENGGSYGRSSNPTHFGRYQFSRSTWAANGGDPAEWGHASPEEQDRVFVNTVNANGYRDWTPYNPC